MQTYNQYILILDYKAIIVLTARTLCHDIDQIRSSV